MANYDASIRVKTKMDNSDIQKAEKEINQYAQNTAEKLGGAAIGLEEENKKAKKLTGTFDSLSGKVDDYRSILENLASRGFGFGDTIYDEAYIQWKNATYAVDEYKKSLDEATIKGQQLAQEKQDQLVEKELEKQEKIRAIEAERIAEEERLAAIKANAIVADQRIVALTNEKMLIESRLAELKRAGVGVGYEEYDKLKVRLSQINSEINDYCNGFKRAEQSAKKCFKTVDNGAKKSSKSLGATMKVLKNIVLSMVGFQAMAKGAEYIASGFKNLVQYSSELNGAFSEWKSQTATLKNSMATAFAPIVAEIISHISRLVEWLNTAMNAISQFWAVLGGKNTYTRAKKQVVDYAASIKDATKAAKGALASFDELNVLNKSDSAGIGGELSGANAFEEVKVDKERFAWAEKLREALNKISEAAAPLIGKVKDGLSWLYENVFVPLGEWAIGTALPAVIELIAEVCKIFGEVIEEFQPVFDWLWDKFLQPLGEWTGDAIIWVIGTLSDLLSSLWYDVLVPFIEWFKENVWPVIQPVIEEFAVVLEEMFVIVDGILRDLRDSLNGVIEFLAGVFTGDWKRAWDGLAQVVEGVWGVIKGIINIILAGIEALVNGVIGGINKIIDALSISINVPEWAQGQVGTDKIVITNLPHIEKVQLPRLATGGTVTSATLANLGEGNKREVVLPLEQNTEWADILADRINNRGGETRVIVELDGKVVYDNVVKRDREFAGRTGHSQFAY